MKEIVYQINNLSFRWNNKTNYLFTNLTLNLYKKNLVSIIGRNGSGKSTLLKILANIITDYTGEVIFNGINLKNTNRLDFAKKTSFVQQSINDNIPLTVSDIVNLGNYPHSINNKNKINSDYKVSNSLKLLKIENMANKNYNTLSGGEKQKVMIARAVCQSNEIMLLDEPTSSLDIHNKKETMEILRGFVENQNMLIIVISHDLNLVTQFSDYTIVIDDNEIFYGDTQSIISDSLINKVFQTDIYSTFLNDKKVFFY